MTDFSIGEFSKASVQLYFPMTSMGTVMVLGGKQALLSQAW
jgi:hypothetical protein